MRLTVCCYVVVAVHACFFITLIWQQNSCYHTGNCYASLWYSAVPDGLCGYELHKAVGQWQ